MPARFDTAGRMVAAGLLRSTFLFSLAAFATARLSAQEGTSSPGNPAKPKFAYVRFWNMVLPPAGAPLGVGELQLMASDNQPLTTAPPSNYYAGYIPVPPATYNFVVRKPSDLNNPLKRLPVALRADTYITILASTRDNQPVVELIDDTIDPKTMADLPGRLTVRQFMNGAQVKVTADRTVSSDMLSYGQTTVLDNLPSHTIPLAMQATIAGAARAWNTDVDFSAARHATLLVVADPYGRFRPRVAIDGQAPGSTPDVGQPAAPRTSSPPIPPTKPPQ